MKKTIYFPVVRTNGNFYLIFEKGDDGVASVVGRANYQEVKDMFEKPYKDNHSRSYEASMSACIAYMNLNPAMVALEVDNDNPDSTFKEVCDLTEKGTYKSFRLNSIAVKNLTGVLLKKDIESQLLTDEPYKIALHREEWFKN